LKNTVNNGSKRMAKVLLMLPNMRSHGRNRVFVVCGNPDCHHNGEVDVSRLPNDLTFNDLQPRMVCTVCDHRGADVSPSWLHHG
jgi:hypothetical protein